MLSSSMRCRCVLFVYCCRCVHCTRCGYSLFSDRPLRRVKTVVLVLVRFHRLLSASPILQTLLAITHTYTPCPKQAAMAAASSFSHDKSVFIVYIVLSTVQILPGTCMYCVPSGQAYTAPSTKQETAKIIAKINAKIPYPSCCGRTLPAFLKANIFRKRVLHEEYQYQGILHRHLTRKISSQSQPSSDLCLLDQLSHSLSTPSPPPLSPRHKLRSWESLPRNHRGGSSGLLRTTMRTLALQSHHHRVGREGRHRVS